MVYVQKYALSMNFKSIRWDKTSTIFYLSSENCAIEELSHFNVLINTFKDVLEVTLQTLSMAVW